MKTPIALILADTHLKEDNIEVNKSIFQQAIQLAKSLGLKQIDHAGDFFHSRKSQSQLVLTTFCEILDGINESGLELYSCVGNHDKTSYSSAESFLDPFAEHPAFNLFRGGGFRNTNKDEVDIAYLSYFTDELYCQELKKFNLKNSPTTVLITHIGVSGAVMNNGTVIASESITPSLFKDFDLTLIGHYHDAQVLAEGRIRYIGASIQHNFGELTGKGATVLYDDLSTEIIPLKYPQYLKYEISPKDLTVKDIEDLKAEKQESGDNIRIVLTGSESELKSFNKQVLIEAGVSVQHKQDELVKDEIESRVEPFSASSLTEEFEAFCIKNKLDLKVGMKYFSKGVLGIHTSEKKQNLKSELKVA